MPRVKEKTKLQPVSDFFLSNFARACANGDQEEVQRVIENQDKYNKKAFENLISTGFHLAVIKKRDTILELLFNSEKKWIKNILNDSHFLFSCCVDSCSYDNLTALTKFLSKLQAVNSIKSWDLEDSLNSFLAQACYVNSLDIVKYLLTNEGLKDKMDVSANTNLALCRAASNDNIDIVRYLVASEEIAKKAVISDDDYEAFFTACNAGAQQVLEYFIFEQKVEYCDSIKSHLIDCELWDIEEMFTRREIHEQKDLLNSSVNCAVDAKSQPKVSKISGGEKIKNKNATNPKTFKL